MHPPSRLFRRTPFLGCHSLSHLSVSFFRFAIRGTIVTINWRSKQVTEMTTSGDQLQRFSPKGSVYACVHLFIDAFICVFTCSSVYSCVLHIIRLFIHPFIYRFIHRFIRLFLCLFIYLFELYFSALTILFIKKRAFELFQFIRASSKCINSSVHRACVLLPGELLY